MTTPQSGSNALGVDFAVSGMTCSACANRLTKVLSRQDGVQSADVNFATERASVRMENGVTLNPAFADALLGTVQKAGFVIPTQSVVLDVLGMTCTACSARVQKALTAVPGVLAAAVSVTSDTAQVSFAPGLCSVDALITAVAQTGYRAERAPTSEEQQTARRQREQKENRKEMALLFGTWLATAPLLLPMVVMPFGLHWMPSAGVQLVLASLIQLFAGARFYKGAFHALRAMSGNMDVLVALGTTSAFVLSVVHMIQGKNELYFEASASVLAFVLIGKYLEKRAKQQTHSAQDALRALRPETCRLVGDDGSVREVSPDAVAVGQRVEVPSQTTVPVDGVVANGSTKLDAAHLTGESDAVRVGVGDAVDAGALNQGGTIVVECTRIGAEGTLARMIRLIEQAQTERAPIERLVDKVSGVFVPIVIAIAAGVLGTHLLLGFDLATAALRAVAVLVVACPCALGLATPTALVVGVGVAAKHGVLFRGAAALERLSHVDVVAFDKTGTLTHGTPKVAAGWTKATDVVVDVGNDLAPMQPELAQAAALERGVPHPLAAAFAGFDDDKWRTSEVENIIGKGMRGALDDNGAVITRTLGALSFNAPVGEALPDFVNDWQRKGLSTLAMRDGDGDLLAVFAVGDVVRDDAVEVVATLQAQGKHVVMISGDQQTVADAVGKQLGLNAVFGDVSPEHKLEEVRRLQKSGEKSVLFVGDGVNDGPALAQADIGMTLSSGTDVALLAADVVSMRDALTAVPTALALGTKTGRTIRQNLFWAFGYNVIALPLAAVGLLSPVLAGAAMALSSTSVVINALRLRRFRASMRSHSTHERPE